jgi:hypothetical protein
MRSEAITAATQQTDHVIAAGFEGDARDARNRVTEAVMLDVLMVALTILFFVIAVAYVDACDRLESRRE